jgi:deazaflavin-dependent oxidoreductase (nitroreductase family)
LKKINPNSSSRNNSFDREQYLYLTTRGRKSGLPREIEIWFSYRDGRFYLIAEYPTANWVQNLRADSAVQLRVAGRSFSAHARFVTLESEPELHRTVAGLSRQKYGWGEGTVVELIPEPNPELTTENRELT